VLAALVQVVLPVVLVAAVGYVLARSFALDRQTLNKVGMHGLTPALAFTSIVKTEVSPGQGVWLVAGYVAANVLAGLVAWAVGGRWPGRTRRGVVACTVIGNNGNFGLPVALLALGQPGLDQALVLFIVSVVVMFTIGPVLYGSHDGLGAGLRSLVRLPVLWALVSATVVRLTGMTVPIGVMRGIELLSAAAIPLVLLQLGVQLGQSRRIHLTAPVLVSVGLRSVLLPLLGLAVAVLLPLPTLSAQSLVLALAMPTAVNAFLLAEEFRGDSEMVASVVAVTTVVAVPVVALVVSLLPLIR